MKTHAIITFSGTHFLIKEEEHEELRDKKLGEFFTMKDGNSVRTNDISEVLTLTKYYEQFPEKRPPITDRYKALPGLGIRGVIDNTKHGLALEGIARGLRKHILSDRYQGTDAPKEFLQMVEKKIKQYQYAET